MTVTDPKTRRIQITIVGAGLAGLTTAYLLQKAGLDTLIIEASDRIGGRIHSVRDAENNFLSGTYTFEKWFQYFNLSNVVLDINTSNPPNLIEGNSYNLTLMGVSEDNWVNLLIQKGFTGQ